MDQQPPIDSLTPGDFERVRQIFEAALEQPTSERRVYVEQACGGDTVLVAEVERMLAADGTAQPLLDRAPSPARGAREKPAPSACPSCQTALAATHRFCPSCGTPIGGLALEGRFRAGALFANRFRIVAALGHGGMGEVYRADDLELGQPVALKFLTALRSDERARARLRGEVRLARQLAHPNVCRVYDIGEAHGDLYLSMEYVDGEDLAALLKRIGHLPIDKGIDIARKLCAGLAAAHAKGVLHRDFKPANIMIDSHGEVRIMDFGLAAVADELQAHDVASGTPAYMAPEQLAGKEVTRQSDLYALGLVLYELFTGKPAFTGKDSYELQRQREGHPATTPSTLIPDLGPRVERAILRCLEPDPRQRPASALDVAAALPGGDPLAEALAAGETPSPDVVAGAGPSEGLRPGVAMACLAGALVSLAVVVALTSSTQLVGMLPFDATPDELSIRARDIARMLGYTVRPNDIASGFRYDDRHVRYLAEAIVTGHGSGVSQWRKALSNVPTPVSFSYRASPAVLLIPSVLTQPWVRAAYEEFTGPPGAVSVDVELDGRLRRFVGSPPAFLELSTASARPQPDWPALFNAAALDITKFDALEVQASTEGTSDSRVAWVSTNANQRGLPISVAGASLRGTVTYFEVAMPWKTPGDLSEGRGSNVETPIPEIIAARTQGLAFVVLTLLIAIAARYQLKVGRDDLRGAVRVGGYAFVTMFVYLSLSAHDLASELTFSGPAPFIASFRGLLYAAGYLALEPLGRRHWPQAMTTWARVVAGRWNDAAVGRDFLVGLLIATTTHVVIQAMSLGAVSYGVAPVRQMDFQILALQTFMGGRVILAGLAFAFMAAPNGLPLLFTVLMARAFLKRTWLAVVISTAFWAAFITLSSLSQGDWVNVATWTVELSVLTFVVLRFSLLSGVTFVWVSVLIRYLVMTTELREWYGHGAIAAVTLISVTAVIAWRVSIGGRSLFGRPLAAVD